MELYIETLTGTFFELRVSPFETIMSVKAKIQRLEGKAVPLGLCQKCLNTNWSNFCFLLCQQDEVDQVNNWDVWKI